MTKLPAKEVLNGSKLPKTTTGEMKDALGKLRDYLSDLLGEDSADREAARLALGIDLAELGAQIGSKSDRTELETRAKMLEAEIAKRGIPVGSIDWFAAATPPAGYLKADGAAVGRQTYPDLFAAIGTTYGEGDGETTFNLPDLIGRFAEGSETPGTVKEAGLPNITGAVGDFLRSHQRATGAFKESSASLGINWNVSGNGGEAYSNVDFKASSSNPIYGASDTVQPPALTLLPCIKAFDATINTGLINVTELANKVTTKATAADAAHAAMPSNNIVGLTYSGHGSTYTAPADGYVTLMGFGASSPLGINVIRSSDNVIIAKNTCSGFVDSDSIMGCSVPVSKGQKFVVFYYGGNITQFTFTYAEGSQP